MAKNKVKQITSNITVLGAGNIGLAIANGINASGIIKSIVKSQAGITRKTQDSFSLEEKAKFKCYDSNREAQRHSQIMILAVQPKQLPDLINEIKENLQPEQILISVVSGASIETIESLLGKKIPIARAMPNTAIKVCQSMTCLAFNKEAEKYEDMVKLIFNSLGKTLVIPESKFAEATVLCGSGTAIAARFMRAYMQAGIQSGFNEHESLLIATQVVKGAAILLQEGTHPEIAIDKVTTPGGCTIAALAEMEHQGFNSALLKAIEAGINRAKNL